MESNHETSDQLLQDIEALLYPDYPPGCPAPAFLQRLQPLLDTIFRIDSAAQEVEDSDSVVLRLITCLNTCFTQCPRQQLMSRVLEAIGSCKGALKNLAVGRVRIKHSKWEAITKQTNPILKLYSISEPTLRQTTDRYYLKYRRIPHLELLLLDRPPLLVSKYRFEELLAEGQLTPHQHHYIALIAAATMGCKYLWQRAVQDFLAGGGDEAWVKEGISATPPFLQKIARLSGNLAYNTPALMLSGCFGECPSGKEKEQLFEGLVVLAYYQCLSCLSTAGGLVSEWNNNEKYLPKAGLAASSDKSFEIVRRYEKRQSQFQEDIAQEIGDILNEEQTEEEARAIEEVKSTTSLAERKASSYHRIRKLSFQEVEREEQEEELESMKCIEELRRTFAKYVSFSSFADNYKPAQPKSHNDIILSSEWEWELQGLQTVESVLGGKARGALQELTGRLKAVGGQAGRRMAHYYHFSNNYIHEFINYRRLLQQLGQVERQYLKVVTKSPFLFSQSTYSKMEQELKQSSLPATDFVLHAVGCKLELAVTLVTLLFDRSQEEPE